MSGKSSNKNFNSKTLMNKTWKMPMKIPKACWNCILKRNKKYVFNILLILRLRLLGISFQHSVDKLKIFISLHSKGLCVGFFHIPHVQLGFVEENKGSMLDFMLPLLLKVCSEVRYCLNSLLFLAFQNWFILKETDSIFVTWTSSLCSETANVI